MQWPDHRPPTTDRLQCRQAWLFWRGCRTLAPGPDEVEKSCISHCMQQSHIQDQPTTLHLIDADQCNTCTLCQGRTCQSETVKEPVQHSSSAWHCPTSCSPTLYGCHACGVAPQIGNIMQHNSQHKIAPLRQLASLAGKTMSQGRAAAFSRHLVLHTLQLFNQHVSNGLRRISLQHACSCSCALCCCLSPVAVNAPHELC